MASATRLAVGSSSFADGGGSLTSAVAPLFGQVDVETLEYESNGRVTRLRRGEAPFRIVKGAYINRGLGVRIPTDGWTIERADSTWPSTLVAAFRRGATTIELHQKPRYPERPLPREGDAVFISADGGTLYVWTAHGADAADALRRFVAGIERAE